nr:ABC transporter permease [Sphaerisporangium corydalis]
MKDTTRRTLHDGAFGVPLVLMVPAAAGLAFLVLPLAGLLVRAPWHAVATRMAGPPVLEALRLSLVTSSAATVAAVLGGVPLAWMLARVAFRGKGVVRALVTVPLILPPVVGGVALLALLGRHGLIGTWLGSSLHLTAPFTPAAVVLAETFMAAPFLVISVEGALRGADSRFEESATVLGASRWTVFRRVTLPLVAPGIAAGVALCWARALGEFGATVTFAGSFPGRPPTMPLAVYLALESDPEAAVALSLVLLLVSVTVLAVLRRHWVNAA